MREVAPALYQKLWRISLIDAAIQRYWTFRVGRLVGRARIACGMTSVHTSRMIGRNARAVARGADWAGRAPDAAGA